MPVCWRPSILLLFGRGWSAGLSSPEEGTSHLLTTPSFPSGAALLSKLWTFYQPLARGSFLSWWGRPGTGSRSGLALSQAQLFPGNDLEQVTYLLRASVSLPINLWMTPASRGWDENHMDDKGKLTCRCSNLSLLLSGGRLVGKHRGEGGGLEWGDWKGRARSGPFPPVCFSTWSPGGGKPLRWLLAALLKHTCHSR